MNSSRIKIILALLGILIIGGILLAVSKSSDTNSDSAGEVADAPPFSNTAVLDFYESWIEARKSLGDDSLPQELITNPILSPAMQLALKEASESFRETGYDPVLCSSFVPTRVKSKNVFDTNEEAQLLMYLNIEGASSNALVNLAPQDGAWVITTIDCSSIEEAPDRGEYNFDREGRVLKESLQAPFDSNNWHLVFEQDGTAGHVAPLFTENTVCTVNGAETPCAEALFEPALVRVQGNMSETGVEVGRIEILE